ncbi:MAG: SUMF1/EgtB/PvdO family nonheme iron enzyme, partial [Vicinamibacteria bacterium]
QKPEDATSCIDKFEFPNIPCSYPVVWIKARDAALVCEAEGKRLCDAHEWEGGCAGSLEEPDYDFALAKGKSLMAGAEAMRSVHNRKDAPTKSWSYGPTYRKGVCGTNSKKSAGCNGGDWAHCGSNTYPAGYFPACHSPSGVYDINGNAAEHMNLPLDETQMSSRGSKTLGVTEMKGSWFIFDKYQAHEGWCRWRAPFWHGTKVMDTASHENYHLGFRCCKSLS